MEHSKISRRQLLIAPAALASSLALAQSGPARVEEDSEQAQALGYRHDTLKVDAKKYPKHQAAQHCANCTFWQGKPNEPWAGCAMFGRKQIANAGWCQVWAKLPG